MSLPCLKIIPRADESKSFVQDVVAYWHQGIKQTVMSLLQIAETQACMYIQGDVQTRPLK